MSLPFDFDRNGYMDEYETFVSLQAMASSRKEAIDLTGDDTFYEGSDATDEIDEGADITDDIDGAGEVESYSNSYTVYGEREDAETGNECGSYYFFDDEVDSKESSTDIPGTDDELMDDNTEDEFEGFDFEKYEQGDYEISFWNAVETWNEEMNEKENDEEEEDDEDDEDDERNYLERDSIDFGNDESIDEFDDFERENCNNNRLLLRNVMIQRKKEEDKRILEQWKVESEIIRQMFPGIFTDRV